MKKQLKNKDTTNYINPNFFSFTNNNENCIRTIFKPVRYVEDKINHIENAHYNNMAIIGAIIGFISFVGLFSIIIPSITIFFLLSIIFGGVLSALLGGVLGLISSNLTVFIHKKSVLILKDQKNMLLYKIQEQLEDIQFQKDILLYLNNLEHNPYVSDIKKEDLEKLRKNLMIAFYDKDYVKAQQIMLEKNYLFKDIDEIILNKIREEEKINNYINNVDIEFKDNNQLINIDEQKIVQEDYRNQV